MKKIFSTVAIAVALFAGYSVYNIQTENELTDIALANVEALSSSAEMGSELRIFTFCSKKKGSIFCSSKRGNRDWALPVEIRLMDSPLEGCPSCPNCPDQDYDCED